MRSVEDAVAMSSPASFRSSASVNATDLVRWSVRPMPRNVPTWAARMKLTLSSSDGPYSFGSNVVAGARLAVKSSIAAIKPPLTWPSTCVGNAGPSNSTVIWPDPDTASTILAPRICASGPYGLRPSTSAYHHGMLALGKRVNNLKRRRPHAILHQTAPRVLRHRSACP
jgi:hypothetical protein